MAGPSDSPSTGRDIPGVIALPPLVYLGGLAIGFVLEIVLPGGSLPGLLGWGLGGGLLVAGLGLLGWWMERLFGQDYRALRARTRRWI